jgi:hypothetical protein
MQRFVIAAAATVALTFSTAGCSVTSHDLRDSTPVAGKAGERAAHRAARVAPQCR